MKQLNQLLAFLLTVPQWKRGHDARDLSNPCSTPPLAVSSLNINAASTPRTTSCNVITMSKKAPKGEYIETVCSPSLFGSKKLTFPQDTGNKVSRRSQIIGTTNIILGGKTVIQAEVIIRGDLVRTYPPSNPSEKQGNTVAVAIGRYCFFSRGCELRPPGKLYKGCVPPLHEREATGVREKRRKTLS